MGYPGFRYQNFKAVLRAPAFVAGQWRQGQKGSFGPRGLGVTVQNNSGSDIAADKLVAVSGFDTTSNLPRIVLAANNTAGHNDVYVTYQKITNGKTGIVFKGGLSGKTLNTNAAAAGSAVYLDSSAGGFTATAPTLGANRILIVGYITIQSSTVGQVEWDIQSFQQSQYLPASFNVISGQGAGPNALTAAQTGANLLFDRAAGIIYTLPAASAANVGTWYDFSTTVTITSNAAKIVTATTGTELLLGSAFVATAAGTQTNFWANGSTHSAVSSDGATKGGLQGGTYQVALVAVNTWMIDCALQSTGTPATPFANS